MKKLDNKGFTLIELIATIVILSLVLSLGALTITTVVKNAKEKDYELLIKEIKNAVEELYIECAYSKNNSIDCPTEEPDGYYYILLQTLLDTGFLRSNTIEESNDPNVHGKFKIVNPKNDEDISKCRIRYKYDGSIIIEPVTNSNINCPSSY